jgi:hypothetical protein
VQGFPVGVIVYRDLIPVREVVSRLTSMVPTGRP